MAIVESGYNSTIKKELEAVVIESDQDLRDTFCDCLKTKNVKILGCGCTNKTVIIFGNSNPDIVFLELTKIQFDSDDAVTKVREKYPTAALAIITDESFVDIRQIIEKYDPDEVFAKPFNWIKINSFLNHIRAKNFR